MADLLISTLTQGLIYALISFGVYITYSILDFPDLGVDGTFPLGAAVTAILLVKGVNPYLTLPISLAVGALAGFVTGFIHVRLRVRNLLAGIITMTALFSINLVIVNGSNLTVERAVDTIFTAAPTVAVLGGMSLLWRKLVVSLLLVIVVKLVLDTYFKTKSGLLLRAVGDNATLVTSLAKDKGSVKIQGLVLSNALVALAGCIVCHEQRSFSATMGTGQLVYGLAAVIIGISLMNFYTGTGMARGLRGFHPLRWLGSPQGTTAVIVGSFLYKACIQAALSLGLPANMMKLITAVLFLLVLVVSGQKGEEIIHA
ncbi:putative ABC transport system permease protein [Oscillibacter sp. PC13]|uniref:ABC transporter permease n=1 Tax=Oscillibacter sp. PC13 TaxID=1855299 RepID=UPI0008F16D65|nr:ABC transporter permease [Oscillibacter sp. PC13]SFP51208.1 putative ABC transport system permease protein [Oscillibacter sp. PC13]